MPRDWTEQILDGCTVREHTRIPYLCKTQWSALGSPTRIRMQKVAKSEKIFEQLVKNSQLTSDGRDWLTLALDPFHDLDHVAAGYPDADTSRTVVSCYQYAADFSKPASVTSSTWDAHVFTLPACETGGDMLMSDGTSSPGGGNFLPDAAPVSKVRNLFNVEMNNSGLPLFPRSHAEAAAATRTVVALPGDQTYFAGASSRIIGMGFEIVDTTADIYKQGALTAYRMPQMPTKTQLGYSSTDRRYTFTTLRYRSPPSTTAEATLLSGTRQWQASEGAYVVCTQNKIQNKIKTDSAVATEICAGNMRGAYAELSAINWLNAADLIAVTAGYPTQNYHVPFNTSGVMLTGLNANSTFRLKIKIYVEQAPLPYQKDLVVLASPSAPYDPAALEAYSKALTHVPVAVVAGDNSFGDWFAGLANVISKIALPISAALTPMFPLAPVVGGAVSAVASAARQVIGGQKRNDALVPKSQSSALRQAQAATTNRQPQRERSGQRKSNK